MEASATKRIAKNTIYMYIRMLFLMLISFYSSRLLLATLGFNDFGIYSVVGSISSTFVAIKSLFSESIQRFLNVAKGKGKDSTNEQISIFNMSIIAHIVLVIIFVVVVESIGLWLLHNKLDIPDTRIDVAYFVFQMTILATTFSILSIPFDALIIANEKMGIYAIISIIDGALKLLFVLVLPIIGCDYLKTYSILIVCIPILTLLIQLIYCKRFSECKFNFRFNKSIFKQVMSLSGWNFFGNISFSLIHEGINMLLNIFGGVVMNAARSIAYQVKSLTSQISNNTMIAVRPMAMQQSVQKSKNEYFDIIILLSRMALFAMYIIAIPIFVYCPQLLSLWLGNIPDYAVLFTRIIVVSVIFRSLHEPLNVMYMAFGSIKRMMIIESAIMLSFLVFTYISLKYYDIIWMPFVFLVIMEMVIIIMLIINAKLEFALPIKRYCKNVILPLFLLLFFGGVLSYLFIKYFKPESYLELFSILLFLFMIITVFILFILNEKEKSIIRRIIRK